MTPDKFGCVGATFKSFSGNYINLLNPDPAMMDLQTIAVSLGRECRFGNHCPVFYSVAEHCILATKLAMIDGVSSTGLRAIFLHDAAEAYLGDMIKPLKNLLPEYSQIESRFECAIQLEFNINFAPYRELVKQYDRIMLKAEKESMWPDDAAEWEGFSSLPMRNVRFHFWPPDEASRQFQIMAQYLRVYGSSLGERNLRDERGFSDE